MHLHLLIWTSNFTEKKKRLFINLSQNKEELWQKRFTTCLHFQQSFFRVYFECVGWLWPPRWQLFQYTHRYGYVFAWGAEDPDNLRGARVKCHFSLSLPQTLDQNKYHPTESRSRLENTKNRSCCQLCRSTPLCLEHRPLNAPTPKTGSR